MQTPALDGAEEKYLIMNKKSLERPPEGKDKMMSSKKIKKQILLVQKISTFKELRNTSQTSGNINSESVSSRSFIFSLVNAIYQ